MSKNSYQYHLLSKQILKLLQKKIQGCQPNNDESYTESIKNITSVDMDIRLSVVMMMKTVNQFRYKGGNHVYKFIGR